MFCRNPPGPVNVLAACGLTFRHAISLWWNPIRYATKLGHTYGDLAFVRLLGYRFYLVNCPALIRELLVVQPKSFRKFERARQTLGSGFGNGLILSEGEGWLRQRRALQPIFHQQRMADYGSIVVAHTQRMLENWRGKPRVNLGVEMTQLAMTIIGEAMFHADLTDRAPHFSRLAFEATDIYGREEYALLMHPDWLPLPAKRRKLATLGEFRGLMRELLAARRGASHAGDDLSSLLVSAMERPAAEGGMTEAQAVDEAMTMFNGGYHSSSMALTWLFYALARNPQVYERVCAEVAGVLAGREPTFADLPSLSYTAMVVKEGLRLYPPAWELFCRENVEDIELGGYSIRRGGLFMAYPFVTQRDPRFFSDPLRFDPERFSPEREQQIPPFAYFPFGGGPHVCIGAAFASMEIALVLASVAQKFTVELAPGQRADVRPVQRVAIRPERDIFIVPTPRKRAEALAAVQAN